MALNIQIGLLKIPVMSINYSNTRYAVNGLHTFSACCKSRIKHNKICSKCGKDVLNTDVRKGLDERTILTDRQEQELKEVLENGLIEVLGFKDFTQNDFISLIPYIQGTKAILPSISKGFKKTDIKTFYSFMLALKELNKVGVVKLVQRAVEHLGILTLDDGHLIFIEIPFNKYRNREELNRLREGVKDIIKVEKIKDIFEFKEQAKDFISSFRKSPKIEDIKEEKAELLSEFVNQIRTGKIKKTKAVKVKAVNPFVTK